MVNLVHIVKSVLVISSHLIVRAFPLGNAFFKMVNAYLWKSDIPAS